jgi:hypothetical protein
MLSVGSFIVPYIGGQNATYWQWINLDTCKIKECTIELLFVQTSAYCKEAARIATTLAWGRTAKCGFTVTALGTSSTSKQQLPDVSTIRFGSPAQPVVFRVFGVCQDHIR